MNPWTRFSFPHPHATRAYAHGAPVITVTPFVESCATCASALERHAGASMRQLVAGLVPALVRDHRDHLSPNEVAGVLRWYAELSPPTGTVEVEGKRYAYRTPRLEYLTTFKRQLATIEAMATRHARAARQARVEAQREQAHKELMRKVERLKAFARPRDNGH